MKKVLFAAFILVLCLTAFSVYAYHPQKNAGLPMVAHTPGVW